MTSHLAEVSVYSWLGYLTVWLAQDLGRTFRLHSLSPSIHVFIELRRAISSREPTAPVCARRPIDNQTAHHRYESRGDME